MNDLYLQDFSRPCTSGEGSVGPSEKTTPRTPHTTPMFSTEQSARHSPTLPRPVEGASTTDRRTPNREEGVESDPDSSVDAEETFPGSSHVTRTDTIQKKNWWKNISFQ